MQVHPWPSKKILQYHQFPQVIPNILFKPRSLTLVPLIDNPWLLLAITHIPNSNMNHHMKELSTFIRCQSTQFLGAISLHPGNSYTVVLSPQETIRMPSPYVSNCTEEYPANIRQKVAPRSKYSSQNCMLYCYDEIFVESCNCSYPFLQEGKETNIITQLS